MKKTLKKTEASIEKNNKEDCVISFRMSCDIQGTGLTHYILMDDKSNTN